MFNITEETKTNAVAAMKEVLGDVPEDKLEEAFEVAVAIVKKQFGL